MRARLERYVGSCAARERARVRQRHGFTVRTPADAGDAAADYLAAAHDYASYRRIRSCQPEPFTRERERLAHEALVAKGGSVRTAPSLFLSPARDAGFCLR